MPNIIINAIIFQKIINMQLFFALQLGNPRVDYLSLDIEGAELAVLNTVPWSKVDIRVVGIETNHVGDVFPGRCV